MTGLAFSTKAATLALLRGRLRTAHIAPLAVTNVSAWRRNRRSFLVRIRDEAGDGPFIVRSSARREDGAAASQAGAYLSLLDVTADGLADAIDQVIASYRKDVQGAKPSGRDEVLVQPMLRRVVRAGVAFSHDPNTCAPYRMINWWEGADTAAVTAGRGGATWQQAAHAPAPPPTELAGIVALLAEVLDLFGDTPLDCEFAVTAPEMLAPEMLAPGTFAPGTFAPQTLWLLQVRPLVLARPPQDAATQATLLTNIADTVARGMQPHPFLIGRSTVYGVMPDWNPAEIIGVRPKPLALSLYRELITDSIWAYQRHNYGYRNLRSFPLMRHFFGLPYIDVRLSFNSFIPADLEDGLAGRLVDHYIDRLLDEPTLHDKVEFEIVYSCYTLDLPQRLARLREHGFSDADLTALSDSLRRLTNRIIHPSEGLWRADAEKLKTLAVRREQLLTSTGDPLERIYWLLEDAKRYGTLPFAGLARAGFVAVQMLASLVAVGALSQDDYDAFLASVSTVSGQLARDRATLDKTSFLARYGHLRPGTYDILSPRYDEAPELYFDWARKPSPPAAARPFALTLAQMREVGRLMAGHGLQADPVGLFDFLQAGIELREWAKFQFTRNLSDALALAAAVGAELGFTRDQLAYCDIATLRELHVGAVDRAGLLRRAIEDGERRHATTLSLSLPPLIARPADVWAFEWPRAQPNFITQKRITAPLAGAASRELAGRIVCIPNADPGFDWLFSHPIAGLITAWGGANSHMAIRAGELGLPAVVGAGEALYRQWAACPRLHVDCSARRVEMLT